MNERIEKLAAECYQAPEFDYKKFAELIVRECVWRSQGCHLADGYNTADQFELGYKKGVDKVTSQIKHHFGIKV